MRPPQAIPHPVSPGQESVWDYPRPPRVEPVPARVRVLFDGETIADTVGALRVLETSHPPTFYLPPSDITMERLRPSARTSGCEWKGVATYYDIIGPGHTAEGAAWCYPDPTPPFSQIEGYVAFYAGKVDGCFVGEDRAAPQPGGLYGGWVTPNVVGPFKGGPGTWGW